MPFTVQIALEGVIAEDSTRGLPTSQMIPEGIMLFHALRSRFQVVLSTFGTSEDAANRWLREQGVRNTDYGRLMLGRDDETPLETRKRHIMAVRSLSYDLRYVVDDNPEVAIFCTSRGITPLCCPHPVYSRSSFLPDSGSGGLSWAAIEETVLAQRKVRADDKRIDVDDVPEELRFS